MKHFSLRHPAIAAAALTAALLSAPAAQQLHGWQWEHLTIDSTRSGHAFGLIAADLTGDGYPEIASGRYVYRNPGLNMAAPWSRAVIPGTVDVTAAADIDGDDRGDLFAVNCDGSYWCEATTADARAWDTLRVGDVYACDHSMSTQGYATGQIVPGGRPEILIATHHSGVVCFSIPNDPANTQWPWVTLEGSYSEGLALGDIDGDGDLDVCGGGTGGGAQAWWAENPGNVDQTPWQRHDVGALGGDLDRIAAFDIDNDGRMDIIATRESSQSPLYWFRQTASGWERQTVATGADYLSMHVADFDDDGDGDIITGEALSPLRVQIWAYRGGLRFDTVLVSSGIQTHIGCLPVDLDNDNDLDIVSNSWTEPHLLHLWRADSPNAVTSPFAGAPLRSGHDSRPFPTGTYDLLGRYGTGDTHGACRWRRDVPGNRSPGSPFRR